MTRARPLCASVTVWLPTALPRTHTILGTRTWTPKSTVSTEPIHIPEMFWTQPMSCSKVQLSNLKELVHCFVFIWWRMRTEGVKFRTAEFNTDYTKHTSTSYAGHLGLSHGYIRDFPFNQHGQSLIKGQISSGQMTISMTFQNHKLHIRYKLFKK